MHIFQGAWSTTGQGSVQRSQGNQSYQAQWTTSASLSNAPIRIFVRASDGRMVISSSHAQLRSPDGVSGTQQTTINGVPQTPSPINLEAFELPFPAAGSAIDSAAANPQFSGSKTVAINGSLGPMQPGGSQGTVQCSWQFAAGATSVTATPGTNPPGTNPGGASTSGMQLTAVVPNSLKPGGTITLMLTGNGFATCGMTGKFGAGVNIPAIPEAPADTQQDVNVTVLSPTSATAVVMVNPQAALGARTITLSTANQGQTATLPNALLLTNTPGTTPGPAALYQVSPNRGWDGAPQLSVTLTGQHTHFTQGVSAADFGPDVTIESLAVNSATSATAVIDIGPSAKAGLRDVTVRTGDESVTLPNGYDLGPGTFILSPSTGSQGQQGLQVTVVAGPNPIGVPFQPGVTADFGPGITISSVNVVSPSKAVVTIGIDPTAATGPRNVVVGTDIPDLSYGHRFVVTPGTTPGTTTGTLPTAATGSLESTVATNARVEASVNPNGSNTNIVFAYGTSSSLSGASKTPSYSMGSGSAFVTISGVLLTGLTAGTTYYYQVQATNGAGTANGAINSFTATPPIPTLTTGVAWSIAATTASISGYVNPNNLDTHIVCAYGTSSKLSEAGKTASQDIGSGVYSIAFSVNLTGLTTGTKYYYQVQATNSAGTTKGPIEIFTTR